MRVRLDPIDEYMHELGPEPNFNESMYFNVYDPAAELGGVLPARQPGQRGLRRDDDVPLPARRSGRRSCSSGPRSHDNDAFDAGGMRFEVIEPFEQLTRQLRRARSSCSTTRSTMADPREGVHREPVRRVHGRRSTTRGVSDMFGGEPEEPHERPGEEFAKGHYEQLVGGDGHDPRRRATSGRSTATACATTRGARATGRRRGTTAGSPPTSATTSASWVAHRPPRRRRHPRRVRVGRRASCHLCHDFEISTEWDGDDQLPPARSTASARQRRRRRASGRSPAGAEPHPAAQPARRACVTRISEGMTEWTLDDGRVGYGLSEYLDQIVDGQPVGLDE